MLPKAHLTSHSRMSDSRWLITQWWLSGSWRSLLYSSLYSCHLLLLSSASVRSIPLLSFIEPIFAWNVPLVSLIILERSLDFPTLIFNLNICTHILFSSFNWGIVDLQCFRYTAKWFNCIYIYKFGKLSSGHRTGKGQFSFQSQRKAIPKTVQTAAQLDSTHMLVK